MGTFTNIEEGLNFFQHLAMVAGIGWLDATIIMKFLFTGVPLNSTSMVFISTMNHKVKIISAQLIVSLFSVTQQINVNLDVNSTFDSIKRLNISLHHQKETKQENSQNNFPFKQQKHIVKN